MKNSKRIVSVFVLVALSIMGLSAQAQQSSDRPLDQLIEGEQHTTQIVA